jgi:sugar lactone lactonase YvrE
MLPLLLLLLAAASDRRVLAHPPSAIVVDDQGTVYFTDAEEGVFQLTPAGKATRVNPVAMHWMALDRRGGFANAADEFGEWFGRITPKGERPALVSCSDFPCDIGPDGNLYFAKMHGLTIIRRTPAGDESTLVKAGDYGLDANQAWGVNGMTCAPDGTIYLVALDSVNKVEGSGEHVLFAIAADGSIRQIARNFVQVQVLEGQEHPEVRPQYCRGMASNENGDVFIAATGSRCVLKLSPNSETSEVLRAERPWSPTGVALFEDSLYVLEYNDEKPTQNREWPLRVRKRDGGGRVSTLIVVRGE